MCIILFVWCEFLRVKSNKLAILCQTYTLVTRQHIKFMSLNTNVWLTINIWHIKSNATVNQMPIYIDYAVVNLGTRIFGQTKFEDPHERTEREPTFRSETLTDVAVVLFPFLEMRNRRRRPSFFPRTEKIVATVSLPFLESRGLSSPIAVVVVVIVPSAKASTHAVLCTSA